jgi:hypothetical protein
MTSLIGLLSNVRLDMRAEWGKLLFFDRFNVYVPCDHRVTLGRSQSAELTGKKKTRSNPES